MIRVLISEDSIVTQKLIELNLKKDSNIEIIDFAFDGLDTIQKFSNLYPDVIIMDFCMPKMNGLDTLKKIRKNSSIPIIFLSSQIEMKDILLKEGATYFIEKSFENMKNLSKIINFSRDLILK